MKPEDPTLPERLILALHLPYVAGCIVFGYFFVGILPSFIAEYVESSSIQKSLDVALVPQNAVTGLVVPYLFYAPRYMRQKLLQTESQLTGLLAGGEEEFHKLFGRVSALRPQLLAWALMAAILLAEFNLVPGLLASLLPNSFAQQSLQTQTGTVTFQGELAFFVASLTIFLSTALVLSSLFWVYYSILKGIRDLGASRLNLLPPYRDSFLGLKPVGSLALSLAAAYFGFEVVFLLTTIFAPPSILDLITVGAVLVGLVVIGILAFFLPLRRLHRRMMLEKGLAREKLAKRFVPIMDDSATLTGVDKGVEHEALEVLKVDLMDRKVSSIATWPFDLPILGKLTIIVLSVTAGCLTRFVILFLHI